MQAHGSGGISFPVVNEHTRIGGVIQPFEAIEESKDPKFDEMTASKIDSDH